MKRPSIYSKPLEGVRKESYHPADLDGQYAKDLNKYIDYLESELKKFREGKTKKKNEEKINKNFN